MPDQDARDRRALKKAQTREDVRRAAQQLFAERPFTEVTVADIASAADVAVQTVFNHFATKEDLFFADRAPWVAGPAAAVTGRLPGTGALSTVHAWLVHHVGAVPVLLRRPALRDLLGTLLVSPSLQVHQRELLREAEERLAGALLASWSQDLGDRPGLRLAAGMTSGLLMTGARVVIAEQWHVLGPVPLDSPALPPLVAEVRRSSRLALDAVLAGFPQLSSQGGSPDALRAVMRLEAQLPPDRRAARTIRPMQDRRRQDLELLTTGSSTVSTRSSTSAAVIGTANAV